MTQSLLVSFLSMIQPASGLDWSGFRQTVQIRSRGFSFFGLRIVEINRLKMLFQNSSRMAVLLKVIQDTFQVLLDGECVHSHKYIWESGQPSCCKLEEFLGTLRVPLAQTEKTAADLQKRTVIFSFFARSLAPGRFKIFMGLLKCALVETLKPLKD